MIAGFITVDRAREVAHAVGRSIVWAGTAAVGVAGMAAVLGGGHLLVQPDNEVLRLTPGLFDGMASSSCSAGDPLDFARHMFLGLLLAGVAALWWSARKLSRTTP